MPTCYTRKTADGRIRYMMKVCKGRHAIKPIYRTFGTKADGEQWAREQERFVERGSMVNYDALRTTTVWDVLERFDRAVTPTRKGARWEHNRIMAWAREPWVRLALDQDIPTALRLWRDRRLAGKGPDGKTFTTFLTKTGLTVRRPIKPSAPQTVCRDLNLLGGVFTYARKEWGIKIANPAHEVKRPASPSGARSLTWSDADLDLWMEHLHFDEDKVPKGATQELPWVIKLLRLVGVRRGTLMSTDPAWVDFEERCIHYPGDVLKNGETWNCPISRAAESVLRKLMSHRGEKDRLFDSTAETISAIYSRERGRLAVSHPHVTALHLHDLRHTWTTATVSKLGGMNLKVAELNLMELTGRKSTTTLKRYFNPKTTTLAELLD